MKHDYIVWGYPKYVPVDIANVQQLSIPTALKTCQLLASDLTHAFLTTIVRSDKSWQDDNEFILNIKQLDDEWRQS